MLPDKGRFLIFLPGTVKWEFVHYAAWSGRAWHASAVFNGAIYIIGGTPLNNEVGQHPRAL